MVKAQVASTLDDLTGIENRLLDRQLVLQGIFKAEIARLLEVQAAAQVTLGNVETVAQAAAARKDADKYAGDTRASADRNFAASKDALGAANAKMEAALAKEKTVASREASAQGLMEDYKAKEGAFDASCAKREAALATREAALSAGQAQLAQDQAALSAKQSALVTKLRAAQELASGA